MRHTVTVLAALALASGAQATVFAEAEGNDSKATANFIAAILNGDSIVGNSIASTGAGLDYFRVRTASSPLGIYRNRFTITTTGTAGHTGTLRGLNQTSSPAGGVIGATDTTVQTATTIGGVPRVSQWYSFGREADMYYRVTGAATTTADYTATYEQVAITPTAVSGVLNSGNITISSIGQTTTDTDFWVYDGNLNAIAGYGNDDESALGGGTGATAQSLLTRLYAPGVYYLAMGRFNLANNQASPADEDFKTGAVFDFADVVATSSTTSNASTAFSISDGVNTFVVTNTAAGPFDINWFTFTVVPAPGSVALLGLAGLAGARRRR